MFTRFQRNERYNAAALNLRMSEMALAVSKYLPITDGLVITDVPTNLKGIRVVMRVRDSSGGGIVAGLVPKNSNGVALTFRKKAMLDGASSSTFFTSEGIEIGKTSDFSAALEFAFSDIMMWRSSNGRWMFQSAIIEIGTLNSFTTVSGVSTTLDGISSIALQDISGAISGSAYKLYGYS